MDIADYAEKASQKQTPAADKEQPEKKVKNKTRGKWNVINFANALLDSGISGDAKTLACYIIANQGDIWKFYPKEVREQTGLSVKKYYECLNELESVKAVYPRIKNRIGKQYEAGVKLIWNYDYQSWEPKAKKAKKTKTKNNPKNGLSQNGNVQNENSQNGLSQNGGSNNVVKTVTSPPPALLPPGNSEHEEKGEGAAAEPPPAPAFSAPAAPAPHTAKAALPDLPETAPEKFRPPTLEKVIAKLVSVFAPDTQIKKAKENRLFWDNDDYPRYAAKFYRHYSNPKINWTVAKGKKRQEMKSWELALLNTWLERDDYMPPWKKNQQQGQSFQQTQERLAIEGVIEMVLSGTATVEGLDITNPETIRYINSEVARRRGYSTAP